MMSQNERRELDQIIEINGTKSWYTPDLFERDIRPIFPEELAIIAPPLAEHENYNCFMYALGFADNRGIIEDSHGFIYSAFIKHLLDKGLLTKTEDPKTGDLVFYQDLVNYPDEITHAGILQGNDAVISKWSWGLIVRHALMDVPASYGDTIWYANSMPKDKATEEYWKSKLFNVR